MPREIRTYKASPVGKEEVPSLTIAFDQEVPDLERPDYGRRAYRDAAKEIVGAMGKTLPGGLFDAILVEMMAGRVSLLRVPHFTEESG